MYSVLVIDDKEVFRRKIKRMRYFHLNNEKFKILYEAQNGLEALEILKNNQVDVVLTDIRMPFIDGIELLRRIYANQMCRCVILLSEFADFSYAKAGILNGAFDYVLKPIDEEKITETFDRAFNYLVTINENLSSKNQGKDIRNLAKFILSNDRTNALSYANHVAAGFSSGALTDFTVSANHALEQLKEYILASNKYLELYIPFDSLCRIESDSNTTDSIVSVFSKQVMLIMDEIEPFFIRSKNEFVVRACKKLLSKAGRDLSLTQIAEELYLNPRYLGALIKKEIGLCFRDYVNFIRISNAKLLLRDPSLKIYEVANAIGYNDIDHFRRLFKKVTSISPGEYQKRML